MKRLLTKHLRGIVLVMLLFPSIAFSNLATYWIEFFVENHLQQPIPDATITLGSTTLPAGFYLFSMPFPDTYSYTVTREGYQPVSGEITIMENQSDPIFIDIVLLPDMTCAYIVHDASGQAGEDILINTEIINVGHPLHSFQVDIELPVEFEYIPGTAQLNPDRKADHLLNASVLPGTHSFRMISFSLTNAAFYGEYGFIASFMLSTPETPGTYQLIPQFTGLGCDTLVIVPGTVTLLPPPVFAGDANCDGILNVMDAVSIINYIMGNNPQPFCFDNADVNGDGTIDVIDVVGTINLILTDFICGTSTLTDYDGNVYNTVQIGSQCWMAGNLKTTTYRNGEPIDYPGEDSYTWFSASNGGYAWYDNNIAWKDSYGALYNWFAVDNSNGLCPAGWHVPSDAEWLQMLGYLESQGYPNQSSDPAGAANALKSCRQVNSPLGGDCNISLHPRWEAHSLHHGTDAVGFSGLPGGYRHWYGSYTDIGTHGYWWTSVSLNTNYKRHYNMGFNSGYVNRFWYTDGYEQSFGFSVRCVKY